MLPVAATPAQPRKLQLLRKKKKPTVSFLPFSESDRAQECQIEAWPFEWTNPTQKSRVMVEEGGALHAISHTRNDADDKLPERNLDSTCCRQSITGSNSRKHKNSNFRPYPNSNKTAFWTVCKTVIHKWQKFTNSDKTVFSNYSNKNKTVFEKKIHFLQQ